MSPSVSSRFLVLAPLSLRAALCLCSLTACNQGGQGFDDGSDELGKSNGKSGDDGGVPTQTAAPADDGSEPSDDDQPALDPGGDDDSEPAADDADPTPPAADAPLPCTVLTDAELTCVAAHSTVRLLVQGYDGPLYQVRVVDGTQHDIFATDGIAEAAAVDEVCSASDCVISVIYDQSGAGNDLTEAPPGGAKTTPGDPVGATELPVALQGRSAYGMLLRPGMGYRKLVGNQTAVGDEPQSIYMVSSEHDLINGCCLNYGNAQVSARNDGNGTAEALYFGMGVIWGTGVGEGPWAMADLENGLYPGWENGQERNVSTNTSLTHDFVTAVLVGDTADNNAGKGRFALYGGDATQGELTTMYDGIRPERPGYVPMQKQGSVVLGIAGDNSNGGGGRFYEGVMVNGAASLETLQALQASIAAAGYGN